MKKLSQMTDRLMGQPMFHVLEKANELERQSNKKLLRFEIGDIDLPPFQHIIDDTKKALDEGHYRYVPSSGIDDFKIAVAEEMLSTHGYEPDLSNIMAIPANAAIDHIIRCILDAGDEVLYPSPGFSTYNSVVGYTGVVGVPYLLNADDDFGYDFDYIESLVTSKTKLMIINSPSNPLGRVMSREEVEDVCYLCRKYDLYLLSDEIYSKLIYEKEFISPYFYEDMRKRTIVQNGFSKNYSMPGWRLGYIVAPMEIIKKVSLLFQTVYSCLPSFIQHAGISAFNSNKELMDERLRVLVNRRNILSQGLNTIPGIQCRPADGSIFLFPDIRNTGMTSNEFVDFVMSECSVVVLPGNVFGENGEGFFRISFARSEDQITEAIKNMRLAFRGAG